VLVSYDRSRQMAVMADRLGRSAEEIRAAVFGSGVEDAADTGEMDAEEHLRAIGDHLGVPDWLSQLLAGGGPDPGVAGRLPRQGLVLTSTAVLVRSRRAPSHALRPGAPSAGFVWAGGDVEVLAALGAGEVLDELLAGEGHSVVGLEDCSNAVDDDGDAPTDSDDPDCPMAAQLVEDCVNGIDDDECPIP